MPRNSIVTCCKEKAVLVAVYEEKPRKRKLTTRNHHHHHHHHHHRHHHHLYVRRSSSSKGNNRRAELLSYSQRLRGFSKSTSPHHPKSLQPSSTKDQQQTMAMMPPLQRKRKSKMQSSCLHLDTIFKCFTISYGKRRVKNKKKQSNKSTTKKANAIMKTFNERTQKGARGLFTKMMAIIQKYR